MEGWGVYENASEQRKSGKEGFGPTTSVYKDALMRVLFTKPGGRSWWDFVWWLTFSAYDDAALRPFTGPAQLTKKELKEAVHQPALRAVIW